jgi:hypothetical protein
MTIPVKQGPVDVLRPKQKVNWYWPTIDSQYAIDVLIKRCRILCCVMTVAIVPLLVAEVMRAVPEFFQRFVFLPYNILVVIVYVFAIWKLPQYSLSAAISLVIIMIFNVSTTAYGELVVRHETFTFVSWILPVLMLMISVNALRAVYVYQNRAFNLDSTTSTID